MVNPELIGSIASILIVASLVFQTTTYRGTMCMRIINIFGSFAFVLYGLRLNAYSTIVTNIAAILISIYYVIKETKYHKIRKEKAK